jgi:23S rRNA (uracil1939-C5)-methyltransferase
LDAVGPAPGIVQELYAGSGNFTRHLLGRATAVYASDGDPAAVARGQRNAPGAAWDRRPQTPNPEPDTVVLDPPREGADRAHLAAAARARRRIIYVSCDPQTLGRDARALVAAGFQLTGAVALDLMPQTFHVEVVATFDRA